MNCKDCFWKFDNECEHCYKWRNIMKAKQIKIKYLRKDMVRVHLIKTVTGLTYELALMSL